MKPEEISVEEATRQVGKTVEWMMTFIEEKDLTAEFAKWLAENRSKELIEMIGVTLGDDVGKSLGVLMDALKSLGKED